MKMRLWLLVLVLVVSLPMTAVGEGVPVWFDQAHGQAFRIDQAGALQLGDFAELMGKHGVMLRGGSMPLTADLLSSVNGLVLSGAFKPLAPDELKAVMEFVNQGGKLVVLLHIAPPLKGLLTHLGVDFSNGVIREQRGVIGGDPLNFSVTDLDQHPLFHGINHFDLYGGWAMRAFDARAHDIARTGPDAWVDLNGNKQFDPIDARQAFAVVVAGSLGKGEFLVFADDAIFQNQFLPGNLPLAANLATWLAARP